MSSKKSNSIQVIDLNRPHTCVFCHRSFAKESTLVSHVCEPKRRHQNQNVSYVKKAFLAWQLFHQSLTPSKTVVSNRTYQEFAASNVYTAFVKFGSWCEENHAQEFLSLVHWLLKENIKIDSWCDLNLYNKYLTDLIDTENCDQAVKRSLDTIKRWATDTNHAWTDFFHVVNVNVAVSWIVHGRISPWVLYNCDSAVTFLERCTPEQLAIIQNTASIKKWKVRFLRMKDDADIIRSTLQEAGL